MTTSNELRAGLLAVAKRSVSIMTACNNEESTKLYLVLPFLGLLGYDYANPYEVYPDHLADFDLTLAKPISPFCATACRSSRSTRSKAGADLFEERSHACASYFNAMADVKLGDPDQRHAVRILRRFGCSQT